MTRLDHVVRTHLDRTRLGRWAAPLLLGLVLLPLLAGRAGDEPPTLAASAPPLPAWESAAAPSGAAALPAVPPARRRGRRVPAGPPAAGPTPGDEPPVRRTRAQRWYGRRLLEGG